LLARIPRTVLAFIIAPIVPTIVIAVMFNVRDAAFYLAVFGYPIVLFVGVPTHLLLQRLGWSGGFIYIGAGFIAGDIGGLLYAVGLTLLDTTPSNQSTIMRLRDTIAFLWRAPELALVIGACGALAALAFWLIEALVERKSEHTAVSR
jgi:hypothetical protein